MQNWPAYLIVILLSRVVTRLGTLPEVNPGVIEGLFSEDLALPAGPLQPDQRADSARWSPPCPHCGETHEVEVPLLGG